MEAYKERFMEELNQLRDRIDKLQAILNKYNRDELDFELNCPVWLLKEQLEGMHLYYASLLARKSIEIDKGGNKYGC